VSDDGRAKRRAETIHFDRLVQHVNETLPDSIKERAKIIEALLEILPQHYERRPALKLQLYAINQMENAQLDLTLEFQNHP